MINFRKELKNIQAYIPGKPIEAVKREYQLDQVIKLASNENPLGTSSQVKQKLKEVASQACQLYPDGSAYALKEKLSEKYQLDSKNILVSNGADEALGIIAQSYLNQGDQVITSENTFVRYRDHSQLMGAQVVEVPMVDYHYNLQGIIDAVNEQTKLIWFCNPNNPTASLIEKDQVKSFFHQIPPDILIVYDEAYSEYAEKGKVWEDSRHFFKEYPNVITVKTFSKIYGLAGLRIGYLTANEQLISIMNRARNPFNVNSLAQIAAQVALDDQAFIEKVYENNLAGKKFLYQLFDQLKLPYVKSQANHIYFQTPGLSSHKLFLELEKRGVIIRPQQGPFSRVSIGTMTENQIFAEKLKEVLS